MKRRSSATIVRCGAVLAAFLAVLPLTAQEEEYPTGREAGRDLAAKLRAMRPEENAMLRGTLRIDGRPQKTPPIPIWCRITLGQTNWTVTYHTSASGTNGEEELTVIYSTNAPNQYLYARAASPGSSMGEPKKLTGAEADIPLAGSDFWLSDLGLEFLSWPNQNRLPGAMRSSRPCYVLQSANPKPQPGGYSWVKTWIEKESGKPLIAEAFRADRTNKFFKIFEVRSVKEDQLKDGKISNEITGSRTHLNLEQEK